MAKTNKIVSVLSVSALAGVMASVIVSSSAFAAVHAYTVKVGDVVYEYNTMALQESFLASKAGSPSVLYTNFTKQIAAAKEFYAFHDGKTGRYIGNDNVTNAFLADRANFKLDAYVESDKAVAVANLPQVIKAVTVVGGEIVLTDKLTSTVAKVASITAITKTSVKVTFKALTVADAAYSVDVFDNNGVKVAVTQVSLEIGETEATLVFKTALTADPTGTWTVGGLQYNNDAVKNFNDIVAAAAGTNQITLLNALNKAGIKNINTNHITNYATNITASATKETIADIQVIVDKTNTTSVTSVEAAAAVKAVNDSTNQIQLLAALQTKAFTNLNADWIVAYDTAIGATNTTVAGIQTLINDANTSAIAAMVPTTVATQNAVTALITLYTVADVAPATAKADAIKASILKSAVFGVKEATTAASIYNALVKLSALDSTTLPATALNANLKVEYFAESVGADYTSVATVKATIVADADANALSAALTTIDAITATTTTTVVKANLQKLADVTSHKGSAKFDMTKVMDASLANYRTSIVAIGTMTQTAIETAIASVNGVANQAINLATLKDTTKTVAQVRDALVELAAIISTTSTTSYLNASSQVKLEIAQIIINNRANLATSTAYVAASITTPSATPTYAANALAAATADHLAELAKFNTLGNLANATITSTNAVLVTYAYAPFTALSTSKQLAVSEEINKLTKSVTVNTTTTVTPLNFGVADAVTTVAQANAYLDAAIAKVK